MPPSPRAPGRRFRVPLAVWIILAVVGAHLAFFWAVSDKHFLPRTRYVPPPPTPNFGARRTESVDPQTGERTTRTDFVVSTQLATPLPSPARRAGSPP